ncbi:hypothetical protein [Pseudomonas sp. RC2C2]|uniref:hypothetical protein n=1 Tax=Pseudomonas sp. RC2C2 TaxID=2834408 RepID=UPI001BCBC086|nr:hypothetical protein [Pseudomonas sp. RC2C2]MBS7601071.1 hypothetical protein [Pseudomonas sp. RC2C2]
MAMDQAERVRLLQLSKAHLITPLVSSTERRARAEAKKKRDEQRANHGEQVKALAGTGVTRNQVAQKLGISYGYMILLVKDNAIELLARGTRHDLHLNL